MKTDLVPTQVIPILGDPVAQVATPLLWNRHFAATGRDAVCVPVELPQAGLGAFVDWVRLARNVPGFLSTVPHKAALLALCDEVEDDAAILGVVNTVRKGADGRLHGQMFDGHGMVAALAAAGFAVTGRTVAICGAGAAGGAIALKAARDGAAGIFVSDIVPQRADALLRKLSGLPGVPMKAGMPDRAEILINASPAGTGGMAQPPFPDALIDACACVADAVTDPEETPLLAAARTRGIPTVAGRQMAAHQAGLMRAYLGVE